MGRTLAPTDPMVFIALIIFTSWLVPVMGIITLPDIIFSDSDSLTVPDIAIILSAVATIVIAFMAWITARTTQKIERERMRPRVVFEFIFERFNVYMRLRNEGLTSARDIIIKTPPKIIETGMQNIFESAFGRPIPFFSPTDKREAKLARDIDFFQKYNPPVFEIEISYKDNMGEKYSDIIPHDLIYMRNAFIQAYRKDKT